MLLVEAVEELAQELVEVRIPVVRDEDVPGPVDAIIEEMLARHLEAAEDERLEELDDVLLDPACGRDDTMDVLVLREVRDGLPDAARDHVRGAAEENRGVLASHDIDDVDGFREVRCLEAGRRRRGEEAVEVESLVMVLLVIVPPDFREMVEVRDVLQLVVLAMMRWLLGRSLALHEYHLSGWFSSKWFARRGL